MPKKISASPTPLTKLSPSQIVACAGVCKETAIKAAKAELPEDSIATIDFKVQIVGSIHKSGSTAGATTLAPPNVILTNLPTFCALLRYWGIGTRRLHDSLLAVGVADEDDPDHTELSTVFVETATEIAATLPQVEVSVGGSGPKVTSTLSAKLIA